MFNREKLVQKWSSYLEDVSDHRMKECLAVMFENELAHISGQTSDVLRGHYNSMNEASPTTTAGIPSFIKELFPMIKRVWVNLVANDLVSVQPIDRPMSGVLVWKPIYATSKGSITAGDEMIENFDKYYSSELVKDEVVGASGTTFTGTLSNSPVKPYSSFGTAGIVFTGVTSGGVTKTIADLSGTGTLAGDTGGASTITYSSGAYNITFDAAVVSVKATYLMDMEAVSANVPEIRFEQSLTGVSVNSRKVKGTWSQESAEDIKAQTGEDIERAIMETFSQELLLGIDRELVDDMYDLAVSGTNKTVFDADVPAGRNAVDHYRNIMTPLSKLAGQIHTSTRRGPGNYIIVPPSVNPIIEALATHGDLKSVFDQGGTTGQGTGGRPAFSLPNAPQGYGVYTLGMLQSKFRVVVDPLMTGNSIVMGLKGREFYDSGLVYAPYVPVQFTQKFADPADFTLRQGARTRYGKVKIEGGNRFYGLLTVSNAP